MNIYKFTVLLLIMVLPFDFALAVDDSKLSEIKTACNIKWAAPLFQFDEDGHAKMLLAVTGGFRTSKQTELYLYDGKTCRKVLSYEGYTLYFYSNEKTTYPGVSIYNNPAPSVHKIIYFKWNGHVYEPIEITGSMKINKEALQLFKTGQMQDAINLWQKAAKLEVIPGLDISANAELLNNLGFAYYKLGREYFDTAEKYLKDSIKIEPSRWSAHLNLGDLYSEQGKYQEAIMQYKSVLNIKRNYKQRKVIVSKISSLSKIVNARTPPKIVNIGFKQSKRMQITFKGKRRTIDIEQYVKAAGQLQGNVILFNHKNNNLYILVDVFGPSRINNGMGYCGAGEEYNLIWMVLDDRLKSLKIESTLYDSCLETVSIDPPYDDESKPRYQIRNDTISLQYISFSNNTKYSFFYDNNKPEAGFTVNSFPYQNDSEKSP